MSVDTVNHAITEEFIVANTAESNNPTVISDGTTIEGWSAGTGALTSLTTENGRIKAVGRGTISVGFKIIKTVSLAGKQFLTFKIECNTKKNLFVLIAQGANRVEFRGTRFPILANTVTSFVLPIRAPAGTTGLYPSTVSGTIDWANDVTLYIGTDQTDESDITFYLDDIQADVARQTTLEIQTPDNLADTSLQLYTHDGTAYQLCRTCKLDSAYASVSDTDANCTLADGTKFSDVYGTGNGRSVFPKGESGQSKNGSLAGSSITYSQNKGTLKRIGLRVDLPPAGTAAPNFSAVRLKVVTFYTDVQGNKVLDLSGNGNHGTIVGGVTKLTEGGLKFDGSTGRVDIKEVTHSLPLTYAVKVKFHDVATNKHCIVIGTYLDYFSLYIRNGAIIARTYADGAVKLCPTPLPDLETWNTIIAEFTQTGVKIYKNSATPSNSITYTSNTANLTWALKIGQNVFEYSNIDLKEAAVIHGLLSDAEKTEIYNSGTLNLVKSKPETFAYWKPVPQNMGSTTYQLSDTTSASTGLQNLSKPWLALYDPAKTEIDFFLHTYRPKQLEFKKDESGNIHELKLFPGNGQLYHGRVTHCNPALDSDSNNIPDCLEASIEGSITKFLQSYGMVI